MSLKTTFLTPHYPNTYMEHFCKILHPDFELGTTCLAWFRQAIKHCTELLADVTTPAEHIWTTVKNLIFPDRRTELVSQKILINIHPDSLSIQHCQSLFFNIVSDYVQRAPEYAAESATNVMLWQVLYSIIGTMGLGCFVIGLLFVYNKYGQGKRMINPLEEVFKPEKRMQASAKRSLRLAKAELRNIHIKPAVKTEDIVPGDGAAVLALKVSTKFELLESVVEGKLHSVGKLHRLYDQYNKTKVDFKIESLNKAMTFLDNNCKKLHLLLMFEDDVHFEETVSARKHKSNNYSIRSLSPPSPRVTTLSPKRTSLRGRLEGGSAIEAETSCRSPRTNVLKQAKSPRPSTTPPSSGVGGSGIPRNVSNRSTIARKSK